ncbi:CHC2 zinc finger domain-containing protein [Sphingomonas sp. BK069]|uniref:CHC2 zinc finger domain-containing protein n=1 Tax=Sphingomonas sp. BK069 TaxID=2586979 RepID=UPI003905F433
MNEYRSTNRQGFRQVSRARCCSSCRGGRLERLRCALLVDVLSGAAPLADTRTQALRTTCQFHPDPTVGLYVYDHGRRFHCFSCGAGGGVAAWLVRRHGLTRAQAESLAGFET